MSVDELRRQFEERTEPEQPANDNGDVELAEHDQEHSHHEKFEFRNDGLYFSGAGSVRQWVRLCQRFEIQGETRDEHGGAWGLLIKWSDSDNKEHAWAMPRKLLIGGDHQAWLGCLVDEGFRCSPVRQLQALLASYLMNFRSKRKLRCVSKTGWHFGCFVLPDAVFESEKSEVSETREDTSACDFRQSKAEVGKVGNEKVVLQGRRTENPYRVAGSLEQWQATIAMLAQENSRLMFSVSVSFVGPLLELNSSESFGFNIWGGSSSGKTTLAQASASSWGPGALKNGFIKSWKATDNSLEAEAEFHNDTLLVLDEVGSASPRVVDSVSYGLFGGTGKGRASRSGDAKPRKSWRVVVLSTGEKTLAAKMAEEGLKSNTGQGVRMIELVADAGKDLGVFENLHCHKTAQELADTIKQAAFANYGHAGRAFVAELAKRRAETTARLQEWMGGGLKEFCSESAIGQVKRVARHFMLVAFAGELAAKWGVVPWEEGEALGAAKKCFSAWMNSRDGKEDEAEEETRLESAVKLFLETQGASRFQLVSDKDGPQCIGEKVINRVGFIALKDGRPIYYVLPEAFRSEVCRGYDAKFAQRVLAKKGMLLKDGKNYTKKPHKELPEVGWKRVYALVMPPDEEISDFSDNVKPKSEEKSHCVTPTSDFSEISDAKTHVLRKNELPALDERPDNWFQGMYG